MSNAVKTQIQELLEIVWKKRWSLGLLIIFAISVFILSQRQDLSPALEDILRGLTSEIMGFILLFLVLERGIERIKKLERFNIVYLPRLNFEDYLYQVQDATEIIRLLDSYTYLIQARGRDDNWPEFQNAIKSALKNKARIEIMLCNPQQEGLQQRAKTVVDSKVTDDNDVDELLRKCHVDLIKLNLFIKSLKAEMGETTPIEVRLIEKLPSITLHLADNTSYWSFFPQDKIANEDDNLQIESKSRLGKFLNEHFEDLWKRENFVTLDQYFGA